MMQLNSRYQILFSFLFFMCFTFQVFSQNNYTLSGYITDQASGETLIGATVYIDELETGTVSNVYGFYSVSVPQGTYTISFRYVGYETITETIVLTSNIKKDVEIAEAGEELEEVTITAEAEDANVSSVEMSVNKLDIKTIQQMPSLLGEADLVRSIQLLPGVVRWVRVPQVLM